MPRAIKNQTLPGLIRVPADDSKPLKYWQATVELAPVDGDRQRKVVRSKDWNTAYRKLLELRAAVRDNPEMSRRSFTVAEWSSTWLDDIAGRKIRPKTAQTYRGLITREILPVIGSKRVDSLTPADIRFVIDSTLAKGLSSTTAMQVHRILVVMLKYALREGHTHRNVATLVDAPRPAATELVALSAEQAIHLIQHSRDSGDLLWSLWAAVLLTGARQGELLGLERDRVGNSIDLSWQLQRLAWQHGCGGTCGRIRGSDCRQRKMVGPSGWAHRHIVGGLWMTAPKSRAGTRDIPLVDPLRTILRDHMSRDTGPNPHGLVWHTADGAPIDPRDESAAWHRALTAAKLPSVRLHDGRHTTVDLLYEAGVPEDLITEIIGHSARVTTRGYKSRGSQRKVAAMELLSDLIKLPTTDTRAALEA